MAQLVCSICGSALPAASNFCSQCGNGTSGKPVIVVQPGRERLWNPGIAAVLSFFIPGLGQIYRGKIFRGLIWMGATAVGYWLLLVPGLILHLLCIIAAYRGNPYKK